MGLGDKMDPDNIAAQVATHFIDRAIQSVIDPIKNLSGKQAAALRQFLRTHYQPHVERNYLYVSRVKTLIERNKPVALDDAFIPPTLGIMRNQSRFDDPQEKLSTDNFLAKLNGGERLLVTAIAGAGKSMLMKKMYCSLAESSEVRSVPLFVELRKFNEFTDVSLLGYIQSDIAAISSKFDHSDLTLALKSGILTLLLDGYDEVRPSLREAIKTQISELSRTYPGINIVISSRPDDDFISWSEFTEYSVLPFTQEQAIALIEIIDFNEKTKRKLVSRIKDDLYESHKEFLSNPLLASMMLLTFDSSYDIPNKRHIFYQRAFVALLEKHDAYKGYRREFKSKLEQDDFERAFSAMCILSYTKQHYSFSSEEEARSFAKQGLELTSVDGESSSFVADLRDNLCMLVTDGQYLSFLHRSFQEYFASLYILRTDTARGLKILEKMFKARPYPDALINMCLEIEPEVVERHLILPKLDRLLGELCPSFPASSPEDFAAHICAEITANKRGAPLRPRRVRAGKRIHPAEREIRLCGGDEGDWAEFFPLLAVMVHAYEETPFSNIWMVIYSGTGQADRPFLFHNEECPKIEGSALTTLKSLHAALKRVRTKLREKYDRADEVFNVFFD